MKADNGVATRTDRPDHTTSWAHDRGTDQLLRDLNDINPGDYRAFSSPIPLDSQDNEEDQDGSVVGVVVLLVIGALLLIGGFLVGRIL